MSYVEAFRSFGVYFCVWCEGVLHVAVRLSPHHLLKRLSPVYILASFVEDELTMGVCVYFWALCSVALICRSVSVPVPCHFDYCSFVVLLEVWEGDASCFVLFLQDCFGNYGSFVVPYTFLGYLF